MNCRLCGACCIALSITSPIPGLKSGKPAGVRCINLTDDSRCAAYDIRPEVCRNFTPSEELCGSSFEEACRNMEILEISTLPS